MNKKSSKKDWMHLYSLIVIKHVANIYRKTRLSKDAKAESGWAAILATVEKKEKERGDTNFMTVIIKAITRE